MKKYSVKNVYIELKFNSTEWGWCNEKNAISKYSSRFKGVSESLFSFLCLNLKFVELKKNSSSTCSHNQAQNLCLSFLVAKSNRLPVNMFNDHNIEYSLYNWSISHHGCEAQLSPPKYTRFQLI